MRHNLAIMQSKEFQDYHAGDEGGGFGDFNRDVFYLPIECLGGFLVD